jgi:hypothetical protein
MLNIEERYAERHAQIFRLRACRRHEPALRPPLRPERRAKVVPLGLEREKFHVTVEGCRGRGPGPGARRRVISLPRSRVHSVVHRLPTGRARAGAAPGGSIDDLGTLTRSACLLIEARRMHSNRSDILASVCDSPSLRPIRAWRQGSLLQSNPTRNLELPVPACSTGNGRHQSKAAVDVRLGEADRRIPRG